MPDRRCKFAARLQLQLLLHLQYRWSSSTAGVARNSRPLRKHCSRFCNILAVCSQGLSCSWLGPFDALQAYNIVVQQLKPKISLFGLAKRSWLFDLGTCQFTPVPWHSSVLVFLSKAAAATSSSILYGAVVQRPSTWEMLPESSA